MSEQNMSKKDVDSAPALEISGLRKSFGKVGILHGVDLSIGHGERVALMGPSGSGKSTLLNCVCGIEPFDGGTINIGTVSLGSLDSSGGERLRRESIGYIFQDFHLLPTLSARENVELPGQLIRMPKAEREERANRLLQQVGLAHRASHRPSALSGGERQRVALARAVMHRPKLLLADEPTGSLDSVIGKQVLELLEELSRSFQIALLLVTHDKACTSICDRVVRMQDGLVTDPAA